MKTIVTTALAITLATGVAFTQDKGKGGGKGGGKAKGPGLTLTTTAFQDGGIIPDKYTQAVGASAVSPALNWTNVPMGTQAFVLHMHDPDVAIGGNTTDVNHWIAWDIPGTATGLPEGVPAQPTLPDGTVQGMNQGNVPGYRGPGAPAAGPPHHYTWELYALNAKLNLPPSTTRDDVLKAINGKIIGKGVLVGRFILPAAPAQGK
jgi:Raf kinase inhibitor-like YbhB/YbcL family protein